MARVPCIVRTGGHRGATALRRSHKPQAATSTPVTAGRRRAYLASCPFCREADGGSSRPGDRLRTVGGSLNSSPSTRLISVIALKRMVPEGVPVAKGCRRAINPSRSGTVPSAHRAAQRSGAGSPAVPFSAYRVKFRSTAGVRVWRLSPASAGRDHSARFGRARACAGTFKFACVPGASPSESTYRPVRPHGAQRRFGCDSATIGSVFARPVIGHHSNRSAHVATRRPCHVGPSRTNFHSGFLFGSRKAAHTAWNTGTSSFAHSK